MSDCGVWARGPSQRFRNLTSFIFELLQRTQTCEHVGLALGGKKEDPIVKTRLRMTGEHDTTPQNKRGTIPEMKHNNA